MTDLVTTDRRWLDAAARIARPWLGSTAGNPTVGAILVDQAGTHVLGRAVTGRGGRPFAEAAAIADARTTRGATLYITLEPDPELVLPAHIARVVIGLANPAPASSGVRKLRDAGIDVVVADHEPSRRLHEGQLTRQKRGRPFVTAKLALSKDGMVGVAGQGKTAPISEHIRRFVHMERALSDAVLIGARTAELDNPHLTVELPGLEDRTHVRVVVAGKGDLSGDLDVTGWISAFPTVVIAETGHMLNLPAAVKVIHVDGRNGRPDLRKGIAALAGQGISRLFAEGGPLLSEALLGAELVDRFHLFTSEIVIGRQGQLAIGLGSFEGRLRAAGLVEVDRRQLGNDLLRTYERNY